MGKVVSRERVAICLIALILLVFVLQAFLHRRAVFPIDLPPGAVIERRDTIGGWREYSYLFMISGDTGPIAERIVESWRLVPVDDDQITYTAVTGQGPAWWRPATSDAAARYWRREDYTGYWSVWVYSDRVFVEYGFF